MDYSQCNEFMPNIEKLDTFAKEDFQEKTERKQMLISRKQRKISLSLYQYILTGLIFLPYHQFYSREVYKKKKVSQKEKNKYMLSCICGIQKNGTDGPIFRAGTEMQTQRADVQTQVEGEGSGINWETGIDIYTLPCVKQWKPAEGHREISSVLCDDLDGQDGRRSLRGKGYMYTYG